VQKAENEGGLFQILISDSIVVCSMKPRNTRAAAHRLVGEPRLTLATLPHFFQSDASMKGMFIEAEPPFEASMEAVGGLLRVCEDCDSSHTGYSRVFSEDDQTTCFAHEDRLELVGG
jgi:hypothetical protein